MADTHERLIGGKRVKWWSKDVPRHRLLSGGPWTPACIKSNGAIRNSNNPPSSTGGDDYRLSLETWRRRLSTKFHQPSKHLVQSDWKIAHTLTGGIKNSAGNSRTDTSDADFADAACPHRCVRIRFVQPNLG